MDWLIVLIFLVVLVVPILLGVPVVYSIGISSATLMLLPLGPSFNAEIFSIRMLRSGEDFILLAIPFYLLAGRLLAESGATDAIFEFASAIVGGVRGGIGQVNVIASIIFSGMSGSAVADAAGLGTIEYDMMKRAEYDDGVAVAVTGSSSIIGPIMPPSIPLIIYGVIAEVSIGDLFLAGIVPALLMAASIMLVVYYQARNRDYPRNTGISIPEVARTFARALPGLLTVVLIIGGIFTGVFTVTEAGAAAALWAAIIGFLFYRDISPRDIWDAAYQTMVDMGAFLSILATAAIYAFVVILAEIPQMFVDILLSVGGGPTVRLLLVVVVLLFLGMVMEPLANIILVVPILAPEFGALGLDPVHTGVVVTLTLMMGLLTPPVGAVLFVLEKVTDVPLEKIAVAMIPYYVPLLAVLLLIVLFPELVLFIPGAA